MPSGVCSAVSPTAAAHRNALAGIAAVCCPRAASGHAAAPTSVRNSRSEDSRNGIYGMSVVGHSGLMPANFTTLAHFSMSSAMNLPKPVEELANAV